MKVFIIILLAFSSLTIGQNSGIIKIKSEAGIKIYLNSDYIGTTSAKYSGLLIEGSPLGNQTLKAVYNGDTFFEEVISVKPFQVSYVKLPVLPKQEISSDNHETSTINIVPRSDQKTISHWFVLPEDETDLNSLEVIFTKFISYYNDAQYKRALPYAWYLLTENPYFAYNTNIFSLTNSTLHNMLRKYRLSDSDLQILNRAIIDLREKRSYYSKHIDSISRNTENRSNIVASDLTTPIPNESLLEIHRRVKYPKEARRLGVRGKVWLKVFVTKLGNVDEIELLKGLSPDCNQAAIDALMKTKFIYNSKMRYNSCSIVITFPPTEYGKIKVVNQDSLLTSFYILNESDKYQVYYNLKSDFPIEDYHAEIKIVCNKKELLIPENISDILLSNNNQSDIKSIWSPTRDEIIKIGENNFRFLLLLHQNEINGFIPIPISYLSEYTYISSEFFNHYTLIDIKEPYVNYDDTITISSDKLSMSGHVNNTDNDIQSIFINDSIIMLDDNNNFNHVNKLDAGFNNIQIFLNYIDHKKSVFQFGVLNRKDFQSKMFKIYSPLLSLGNTAIAKKQDIRIEGKVLSENDILFFTLNANNIQLNRNKEFNINHSLNPGINNITLAYTDELDNSEEFRFTIEYQVDSTPPEIQIIYPPLNSLQELKQTKITLHGRIIHDNDFYKLFINEISVELDNDDEFLYELNLRKGENYIRIEAYDNSGNKDTINIKLTL